MTQTDVRAAVRKAASTDATRRFLLTNFAAFVVYYSGLNLSWFQTVICEVIVKYPRLVCLLPAGHGKSTLISKWYVIWRICQNPNVRIILVMKNDKEVSFYARAIRRELSNNIKLIRDFGPFEPEGKNAVWSNEAIEVVGRQIRESQPTVEFAGSNSIDQVLGHRCDFFIADDIVTPKTVNTQELRDKQLSDWNLGIETGPQRLWDYDYEKHEWVNKPEDIFWPDYLWEYGIVDSEQGLIPGTVFHPDDLFHHKGRSPQNVVPGKVVKGNDPAYMMLYFDCYKHDENNDVTEEPLWPERWTKEKLLLREESMGRLDFQKRMRNIAIDPASLSFHKVWVRGGTEYDIQYRGCVDRNLSFGTELRDSCDFVALGLDPSSGRRHSGATWSCYTLLGVNRKELKNDDWAHLPRYVIDIFRSQLGYDDILSYLLEGNPAAGVPGFYEMYRYDEARVEINSAQTWLLENHRVKTAKLGGIKIEPHETERNKTDPIMGVMSMQEMVREGLLRIPYATATDQEKARAFLEQMEMYPEGLTDYPMSCWFAELAVRNIFTRTKYRSWGSSGISMHHTYFERR
jgi:hypothetical protein